MKEINPSYVRYDILRNFLKKGALFGIVFGIAMLPAVFKGFAFFNRLFLCVQGDLLRIGIFAAAGAYMDHL